MIEHKCRFSSLLPLKHQELLFSLHVLAPDMARSPLLPPGGRGVWDGARRMPRDMGCEPPRAAPGTVRVVSAAWLSPLPDHNDCKIS